jgi:hypothetical protein
MIAHRRFALIRESQSPVYVPSLAELRAMHREQLARSALVIGAWLAVAAVVVWGWMS